MGAAMKWCVILLAAIVAQSTPAQADAFLQSLAGNWLGSGWARRDPDSARETLRCRVRNSYAVATASLRIVGRCAAPGQNRSLRISLSYKAHSGVYAGRLANPNGAGGAELVGRLSGGVLLLRYVTKIEETGQTLAGSLQIRKTPSGFSVSSNGALRETGRSGALGRLQFRR